MRSGLVQVAGHACLLSIAVTALSGSQTTTCLQHVLEMIFVHWTNTETWEVSSTDSRITRPPHAELRTQASMFIGLKNPDVKLTSSCGVCIMACIPIWVQVCVLKVSAVNSFLHFLAKVPITK
jgi:hypothetical protein